MPVTIKAVPADDIDVTEEQVEAVVEASHGDARAAVRALLIGQVMLRESISAGYERRLPLAKLSDVQGK